jgi:hypothetical protein
MDIRAEVDQAASVSVINELPPPPKDWQQVNVPGASLRLPPSSAKLKAWAGPPDAPRSYELDCEGLTGGITCPRGIIPRGQFPRYRELVAERLWKGNQGKKQLNNREERIILVEAKTIAAVLKYARVTDAARDVPPEACLAEVFSQDFTRYVAISLLAKPGTTIPKGLLQRIVGSVQFLAQEGGR